MRIRPIPFVVALASLCRCRRQRRTAAGRMSTIASATTRRAYGIRTLYRGWSGALTIAQVGGAIWEGSESRFGKTMWQGIDSEIIGDVSAEAGKYIFTRARPNPQQNPCLWFQGGSNHSFPSGEASVSAALVTPYVIEYAQDNPAAYALLLLPLYVGAGRIKNQAHWQTDVLAGWAVGGLSGWYAHSRDTPILIEILPHGFAVGLKTQFLMPAGPARRDRLVGGRMMDYTPRRIGHT